MIKAKNESIITLTGIPAKRCKEYLIFRAARDRCRNPKVESYRFYGAQGIQFRFKSFAQFWSELGPKPPGKTLDRIRNAGHYEPGNVRWATAREQAANSRSTKFAPNIIEAVKIAKNNGLTQCAIGALFNISQPRVSEILRGSPQRKRR